MRGDGFEVEDFREAGQGKFRLPAMAALAAGEGPNAHQDITGAVICGAPFCDFEQPCGRMASVDPFEVLMWGQEYLTGDRFGDFVAAYGLEDDAKASVGIGSVRSCPT